jgi:hypothetical protein
MFRVLVALTNSSQVFKARSKSSNTLRPPINTKGFSLLAMAMGEDIGLFIMDNLGIEFKFLFRQWLIIEYR